MRGELVRVEASPRTRLVIALHRVLDDPSAACRAECACRHARALDQDVGDVHGRLLVRRQSGQAVDVLGRAHGTYALVRPVAADGEGAARHGEESPTHDAGMDGVEILVKHLVGEQTVSLVELDLPIHAVAAVDRSPLSAHAGLGHVHAREPVEHGHQWAPRLGVARYARGLVRRRGIVHVHARHEAHLRRRLGRHLG